MICGGRAGPETMRRGPGGVAAGGVNARLRLSGPFVSPPPDWTSQIRGRWNTIRRRGRLYRNLPPPPPPQTLLPRARALARLFSVRNELWSHGGPIGCSTPLCTTGPVQTGLSPGPAVRLKPNEAKEPVYTIGVWTRKTARQPGREQQGEACSMETYIRVLVSRGNGRRMIRVSRYLVGSTGRRGREMGGMDESLFLIDLFSSRLRIYYISFHYYWKIVKNLDDIDNQFFLRRKKLNWEEQTKLEVNLEEERYKFVRITR